MAEQVVCLRSTHRNHSDPSSYVPDPRIQGELSGVSHTMVDGEAGVSGEVLVQQPFKTQRWETVEQNRLAVLYLSSIE